MASWWPSQLVSRPTFETPTKPPWGRLKVMPETRSFTGVSLRSPLASGLAFMSKSSTSFHIGGRKTRCRCWPRYSCVICSSMAWLVFGRPPNSGEAGSRTWKSIGPCLIWMIDVVGELAVERMEVVVGGFGAIVLGIVPIHFVVVDEAAIEQDAAVRLECVGDDVGGVGVRAAVFGGAEPAFAIGLEHESAEIGDHFVDLVDLLFPECDGRGIERIERADAADLLAGWRSRVRCRASRPRGGRRRRCGRLRAAVRRRSRGCRR